MLILWQIITHRAQALEIFFLLQGFACITNTKLGSAIEAS